jgi:hypothetical protein
MISLQGRPFHELASAAGDAVKGRFVRGAQLLTIAADFDALELQGMPQVRILETLHDRRERYDQVVVEAFTVERRSSMRPVEIRDITTLQLRVGMVLAADVKLRTGTLIVTRGFVVTSSFVERLRNFGSAVLEPIRIVVQEE